MSSNENITTLMEVTGLSQEASKSILQICDNNVERAINYHLENDGDDGIAQAEYVSNSSGTANQPTSSAAGNSKDTSTCVSENASLPDISNTDEDNVRAPIPAKREKLLMPEDDNFRVNNTGRKRRPLFTVCPLRNFAREAELQEEQMIGGPPTIDESDLPDLIQHSDGKGISHDSYMRSAARWDTYSKSDKCKRLEDLFRPPIDLLFCGTFKAARDHSASLNRWLIVNLQDQKEFKSQVLNRDIWPEKDLKKLINKYFILWQVSVENPEGLRFKTFYHCKNVPYVCILDPRTGEEKTVCNPVTPKVFRSELVDFLNENSFSLDPSETSPSSSSATSTLTKNHSYPEPSTSSSSSSSSSSSQRKRPVSPTSTAISSNSKKTKKNKSHTSELSEDDQLAMAIRNSLKENSSSNDKDDRNTCDGSTNSEDDNEDSSDNNSLLGTGTELVNKETKDSYMNYMGEKYEPITKIQLRLPFDETAKVALDWPSTTKLRAIRLYIVEKFGHKIDVPYKLIAAFPRKDILELDDTLTLKDANLHPTSILHLHLDD